MNSAQLSGSYVALVTPMTRDGEVDYSALDRLLTRQLDAGTDGIVVAGTTGEGASVSESELARLLDRAIGRVAGQVPVLAGVGAPSTARTRHLASLAEASRADGLLCVTPYYLRTTQAGLLAHYRALTQHVTVPLVLYNVPGRTGVDLLPETVGLLAAETRVIGHKEAVAGAERIELIRRHTGAEFAIMSGDDPSSLAAMQAGAAGVISITANVAPAAVSRAARLARENRWEEARALDEQLQALHQVLVSEPNPIPVKWALAQLGLCEAGVRLPLVAPAENTKMAISECLDRLAALIGS